jgi:ArsR family transcriptional regulator
MTDLYAHLNALSDPNRVRLLNLLDREELGVGELCRALELPQSTISRHTKALLQAGFIRRRAQGTASWLRLEPTDLPEDALRLWGLVRERLAADGLYADDVRRMEVVLSMRPVEGQRFFQRVADRWQALRREFFGDDFVLPSLLALLPGEQTVADLGCGTGEAVCALAPFVRRAIGVDREAAMLRRARARAAGLDNVELLEGSIDALPIADGTLDAALCVLVLHHVEDPIAAFRDCSRTLRSGGRLIVVDMLEHEREELRETMDHLHLGFSEACLAAFAGSAGLTLRVHHPLPSQEGVLGPPLFLAVFERVIIP